MTEKLQEVEFNDYAKKFAEQDDDLLLYLVYEVDHKYVSKIKDKELALDVYKDILAEDKFIINSFVPNNITREMVEDIIAWESKNETGDLKLEKLPLIDKDIEYLIDNSPESLTVDMIKDKSIYNNDDLCINLIWNGGHRDINDEIMKYNKSEKVQLELLAQNPYRIKSISIKLDEEIIINLLKKNYTLIDHLQEDMITANVLKEFFKNVSPRYFLNNVRYIGNKRRYVSLFDQLITDEEDILELLKTNPDAIYIINPVNFKIEYARILLNKFFSGVRNVLTFCNRDAQDYLSFRSKLYSYYNYIEITNIYAIFREVIKEMQDTLTEEMIIELAQYTTPEFVLHVIDPYGDLARSIVYANNGYIKYIHKSLQTKEMVDEILDINYTLLPYIRQDLLTKERCIEMLESCIVPFRTIIRYFPREVLVTEEVKAATMNYHYDEFNRELFQARYNTRNTL